jgi:Nucleoside-diphosphate-sugar epimerases
MDEAVLGGLIERADVVFHLAAAVGVRLVIEKPVHTIETNVHGTETVLRHARRHGKLVLVASTSEVYGKSAKLPFREDADLSWARRRKRGGATRPASSWTSSWRWATGRNIGLR